MYNTGTIQLQTAISTEAIQLGNSLPEAVVYTLTAESGSYTMTGTATGLIYARIMTADTTSYVMTGQDATIGKHYTLTADTTSFTYTGQDATFSRDYNLTADSQTFVMTGQDATTEHHRIMTADTTSYVMTGTDATLTYSANNNYTLTAETGSYTMTGQNSGLLYARHLDAESGTYTETGTAANLEYNRHLDADSQSYTMTGADATLLRGYALDADSASYVMTGAAASTLYNRHLDATSQTYTMTGTDATLTYNTGSYDSAGGLEFDGSNDNIDLTGSGDALAVGDTWSISVWIKPTTGWSGGETIVTENVSSSGHFAGFLNQGGADEFEYHYNGTKVTWSGCGLSIGTWYHVAIVKDTSTAISVHIDGTDKGQKTVVNDTADFGKIGRKYYSGNYIHCVMDDFAFFDVALSDTEVGNIYNSGDGAAPDGDQTPTRWYKFNETTGSTATDSGSDGIDGPLQNFPGDDSQWTDGFTT